MKIIDLTKHDLYTTVCASIKAMKVWLSYAHI